MKKLIAFSLFSILFFTVGCKQKKSSSDSLLNIEQNDSLKDIVSQRDQQINEMMATMNEIQAGFY